jgi:hypothetical protein
MDGPIISVHTSFAQSVSIVSSVEVGGGSEGGGSRVGVVQPLSFRVPTDDCSSHSSWSVSSIASSKLSDALLSSLWSDSSCSSMTSDKASQSDRTLARDLVLYRGL